MVERQGGGTAGLFTSGFFLRDLELSPRANAGMAVLTDLLRMTGDAQFMGLRGIAGATIQRREHVGVSEGSLAPGTG